MIGLLEALRSADIITTSGIDSLARSTLRAAASGRLNSNLRTVVASGPMTVEAMASPVIVLQFRPASAQWSSAFGVTVLAMPTLKGSKSTIVRGGMSGLRAVFRPRAAIEGNGSISRVLQIWITGPFGWWT